MRMKGEKMYADIVEVSMERDGFGVSTTTATVRFGGVVKMDELRRMIRHFQIEPRWVKGVPDIDKIYVNEKKRTTVVTFEDGTKEKIKLGKGDKFDVYNAVAICIAKKRYGNNSAFKKEIKDKVIVQK